MVPESDIVFLEREPVQNHEEAASFEVADIPSVRQQAFPPPSHNDPIPTFEIFPDFSHDRSQQHFLVSPEPPRQTPSATEVYFPVVNDTPPGPPAPRTVAPATVKTTDPLLPEKLPLPPQKSPASSTPPEKKAMFFSSGSSKNPGSLDSLLINIVCSEPLLSEENLLVRLKEVLPDITKHSLRQALVRNGLDTDYKRFRAYMTG
ncbi:MAG: hypothetical protein JW913_10670 [Chitinispirillaceae bacterium]|nr:hypothetical protein [Chitinispirillaceae bacterium]